MVNVRIMAMVVFALVSLMIGKNQEKDLSSIDSGQERLSMPLNRL